MTESSTQHFIQNQSGTQLGLTHFPAKHPSQGPVILAHGAFSNNRSLRGLAQHLSDSGFDSWVLDFQGHGHSAQPEKPPSFESMCLEDCEAVLSFLSQRYPTEKISWVGHSGGGLAILMYLARNPELIDQFNTIVTLASQSTHAATTALKRSSIRLCQLTTALLGFAPGKRLKLGPENEFGPVMMQWYQWSLSGEWRGADGFSYTDALANIQLPCLMFSGSGDRFIAPKAGCRFLFDKLVSTNKQFIECGIESGFLENYNHARIISSRNASEDIWPKISAWLNTYKN